MLGKPISSHLGDDAEQPLGPHHHPEQVVAAAVQVLAAQPHHLAVDRDHLDPGHVVRGQAVFEAVHAAGVFGHVAADGARDLAGRVGCIVEAAVLHGMGDGEVGDARLRHDAAVVDVDLKDPPEPAHAQQHAVGQRQRAARQGGAGAARHHLDAVAAAVAQHLGHLGGGFRQHDHHRQGAVGGQRVALVDPPLRFGVGHAFAGHDAAECGDDLAASYQHVLVGYGHLYHRVLLPGLCRRYVLASDGWALIASPAAPGFAR